MSVAIIFFLFLILLYTEHLALAQNETQFIYNGFNGSNLHLDGNATTILPSGLLQLTNTSTNIAGHAFHPFPLKFNSSSSGTPEYRSFSTNFVVAIVTESENTKGHGMAFVISPTMDFSKASPNLYLGLFNNSNDGNPSNHIVAVELDTVLSQTVDDIDDHHVGIDVNSLNSNASAPASYYLNGKNESLNLTNGHPIQVWIEYDDVKKLFIVSIAPANIPKPSLPLLSTSLDLSSILLDYMYAGFSASTGALISYHYVLGWSFNKSGQSQNLDISKLPQLPSPPPPPSKGSHLSVPVIISIVVGLGISVGVVVVYIIRRQRYSETREDWEQEYGPQRFAYKDLHRATKGFDDKEFLGSGGFGNVYRGLLTSSDQEIAVKRIYNCSEQGLRQFVAEIVSMGRLRHRNLVQLHGYCRRKGQLLLVYDYMPNGSVDLFLFSDKKENLSWLHRFKILRDVASALLYLHEGWEQVVVHRDVKASNVMLDADMTGRLGDFGLARFYDHGANPESTCVVGTVGYIAPELPRTGLATTSSDVFAFGAFMLEMACGRRPIEGLRTPEERVLVDWVSKSFQRGDIFETCDPRLEGDYVEEEMKLVLQLGLLCSHSEPDVRPSISQVVQYLSGDSSLPDIATDEVRTGPIMTQPSSSSSESMEVVTTDIIMTRHSSSSSEHSLYGHD